MGVVRATWAARPHLEKAGGGAVLNISSISGVGPSANIAYGAVKAAVIQLTQSHAMTLANQKIRVNCIAPGGVSTPILYGGLGANKEAVDQALLMAQPLPRAGQPEDIAATASFLLSEEAGFVSGQVIYVAGGPRD